MNSIDQLKTILAGRYQVRGLEDRFRTVSIDSRSLRPGQLFWALKGPRYDGHRYVRHAIQKGAAGCVVSQKISQGRSLRKTILCVDDTLQALQKAAQWQRAHHNVAHVVAVIGSNGKTSCKELLAHLLCQVTSVDKTPGNHNNHIGLPLAILNMPRTVKVFIAEMGMNHFGEIDFLSRLIQPTDVVFTNIGLAHIEGLKSISGVFRAKTEVLRHLPKKAIVVVNNDDPYLRAVAKNKNASNWRVISYGHRNAAHVRACHIQTTNTGMRFNAGVFQSIDLPCWGHHNVMNATAAIAMAKTLFPAHSYSRRMFQGFHLPGMRCQIVRKKAMVFINDAYNANPSSMNAALKMFVSLPHAAKRRVVIMGDMAECGRKTRSFHQRCIDAIVSFKIDILVAIGNLGADVIRNKDVPKTTEILSYHDVDAFRRDMDNVLQRGDLVLVKGSRTMRLERLLSS